MSHSLHHVLLLSWHLIHHHLLLNVIINKLPIVINIIFDSCIWCLLKHRIVSFLNWCKIYISYHALLASNQAMINAGVAVRSSRSCVPPIYRHISVLIVSFFVCVWVLVLLEHALQTACHLRRHRLSIVMHTWCHDIIWMFIVPHIRVHYLPSLLIVSHRETVIFIKSYTLSCLSMSRI